MHNTEPNAKILIVDDDRNLRRTMALILKHKGYSAETVENGARAIDRVREQPFDVILMDIRMPVLDGVQALKEIKRIRPEAVVFMMTAYAVEDMVQDALQQGAFGVLYKPIEVEHVITLVETAVKVQQSTLVLIVDADQDTCIQLQNVLQQHDYSVLLAHDGKEAIAAARKTSCDVLLIDLMLPELNGLETYLAIREINPKIVAIVLTTRSQDVAELAEQALDQSTYMCLDKPIDVNHLLTLLYQIEANKQDS